MALAAFLIFTGAGISMRPACADPVVIDLQAARQVIAGFGGSSAWSGALSDSVMESLYGNDGSAQIGLSLLRVRIDPDRNWADETSNARLAHAHGARVLGTPWTPPAAMKSNDDAIGGELKASEYAAYAAFLNSASAAIGLDDCSIQNEPDIKVGYESCTWSAAQLLTFCQEDAPLIGRPVVMPESYHFDDALLDPTLNDSLSASHIAIVGGHLYGGGLAVHQTALNHGKPVWMTEHYLNGSDIGTCCAIGKEINACMSDGMSAYFWWVMTWGGCKIIDHGTLLKNGYTIGQFSKFIRPGFRRVETTGTPAPDVSVTGYTGPHGAVVVVAVNTGQADVSQTFDFARGRITRVTPYQTTGTANLMALSALPVRDNSLTVTLPAQSITTFTK